MDIPNYKAWIDSQMRGTLLHKRIERKGLFQYDPPLL